MGAGAGPDRGGLAAGPPSLQGLLGCRIGGVASLKQKDVDLARGFVTIRNKGKVRTVPLTPEAKAILERWTRPDPSGSGRVFHAASVSTIRSTLGTRHIKAACEAEGLPYFTPHALRRMVERELALAGVPIQTFAAILGHTPQVALAAYSAVREEDMKAAFVKAAGRPELVERAGTRAAPSGSAAGSCRAAPLDPMPASPLVEATALATAVLLLSAGVRGLLCAFGADCATSTAIELLTSYYSPL